jgi:signal transduction histidine kinase
VLATVVGFGLTKHNNDQQEQSLLQSNTSEAAAYTSAEFSGLGTSLSSAAAYVEFTDGSPSKFGLEYKASFLLVKKSGADYVVAAGSVGGFHLGQVLEGATLATVERAGRAKPVNGQIPFIAGPVNFNGSLSTARFAVAVQPAASVPAGLVIYDQIPLDPYKLPKAILKPFEPLLATLYGSGNTDVGHLLVSTSSSAALSGPVARATVTVGASDWTLVAAARHPFIGGFAKFFPTFLLVLGLLMALIVGTAVEILHRRQRYASELVEERTSDLNRSLQNLEAAQDALVRGERLTAVGEMAMVVGHELRNPLAAVTNALYLIRGELREPISEMLSRNISMAERETHKAATLADDLTAFVRPREMEWSPIDVEGLVEEVISVAPPPPGIDLITNLEPFTLVADRGQMAEILTNLVTNAYQAIPDGGTIRINTLLGADGARLVVEDSGPGFDEAVADRVFEPFFTTKYSGTGLGLAIVHRLVNAHGGTIDVGNVPTGGARVTVVLPQILEVITS